MVDRTKIDKIKSHLLQEVDSAHWSGDVQDFGDRYISDLERRTSGSTMNPSPGVSSYVLSGRLFVGKNDFGDGKLSVPELHRTEYSMSVQYRPGVMEFFRTLPTEQLTHRSGAVASGFWRLVPNEMRRRVGGKEQMLSSLLAIAPSPRFSHELMSVILDATKRHLKFDEAHTRSYIKEHENSSMGGGIKWADLEHWEASDLKEFYSSVSAVIERIEDGSGGFNRPYNMGFRSRRLPLSKEEVLTGRADQEMYRTRLVMFDPALSSWTAFIPDKTGWYEEILQGAASLMGLSAEWHCPLIEGGAIYKLADELFRDKGKFIARDGVNWESAIPYLGEGLEPFWTNFGGTSHLPSGISLTSVLGTVASMWEYSERVAPASGGDPTAIILGDDLNVFSDKVGNLEASPISQYEEMDTRMRFILGYIWRYGDPRICGVKWTADSPEQSQYLPIGDDGEYHDKVKGRASIAQQDAWLGLYESRVGDRDLLDILQEIKPKDYRSSLSQRIVDMASS